MPKHVTISGSRVVSEVEISAAKIAKGAAITEAQQQAEDAAIAAEQAIKQSRPAAEIIQKIKDGTNLTAAEMQLVVRHLALRALRGV